MSGTDVVRNKTQMSTYLQIDNGQSAKCRMCSQIFYNENDKLVVCDRCEDWVCLPCARLSDAQYEAIDVNLLWYCSDCKVPAVQAVKVYRSIEEICKAYFDSFKSEFKQEIDTQLSDIRNDIKVLKNQSTQQETNVETTAKKVVEESMNVQEEELMEREQRKGNLILFHI